MRISLVVPTIRRVEPLRRLFESLRAQTYRDFQVLLADQNPPEMLDSLIREYSHVFVIKRVMIAPCGVSAARNSVLPLATGDVVAFPDDDCFYHPDTLASVARLFERHSEYDVLLGCWHAPSEASSSLPQPARPTHETRYSVFRRGETYIQFYRQKAAQAVGLFDPQLGPGTGLPYGCGEDTDFLLRAMAAGCTVGRTPAIRVYHPVVNLDDPGLTQKARAYGRGRMHLLKKHSLPLWFVMLNVLYPLARMPLEGRKAFGYRWKMFQGRFEGLLARSETLK